MVAWERDRSVPQGASMLLPLAWSPLFWLAILLEARAGWSNTITLLFVGLGSTTVGFPLFVLGESRPLAQQKARAGLGALGGLCIVALVDVGLSSWVFSMLGLLLWLVSVWVIQQALATPRWRALLLVEAASLGPEWRRLEGPEGGYVQQIGGTRGLLSFSSADAWLDVTGPDEERLTPLDFGLDDPEEA